jgi:hypothetical protein|tara:strand:- start:133 stop:732 length:600 start_codon:yes stop_codon:yes gene_type:complete
MANENNWVKILIDKLELSTTAEFCRKADLGRGLVDKLSAGLNQPRFDTLKKIKDAFPHTNMNWLISGEGEVLEDVKDDVEIKLTELYLSKIKCVENPRLKNYLLASIEQFAQDYTELEEMENNAKEQLVTDKHLMMFHMELLFFQYRRRIVSNTLKQAPDEGTILTGFVPGRIEKYNELLDVINEQILNSVNLVTDDEE